MIHTKRLAHTNPLTAVLCVVCACSASLVWFTTASHGQLRVVNYNVAQLMGDEDALKETFTALHADDKPGFAVPVSVFLFQEVRTVDHAVLHQLLNETAPPGVLYASGTYNSQNQDDFAGAQAMFYRAGMLLEVPAEYATFHTGAGRLTDRWRLRVLGYDSPLARFFAYSSHLKAGDSAADADLRLWGVQQIRNNSHALGPGQYIIYAGDHNFYHHQEPGYTWWFHAMQHNAAFDPLGTSSWAGPSFNAAIKHTQSPRKFPGGGLIGGGMDDRFDFHLATSKFQDGQGLSRIDVPWAYRSFGNDGLKYNLSINDGNNFYYPDDVPRSNALADALHDASDHIPVVVDYQLPARMAATITPTNFGKVIQGAQIEIDWSVTNNVNTAHVVTPIGAEVLQFTAAGSGSIVGEQSGFVAALSPAADGTLILDTSASSPGPVTGTITFTSLNEAVQPPQLVRTTSGTVVAPSQPSFSANEVDQSLTIELDLEPDTGEYIIDVPVHNFGFGSSQALLNVTGVSGIEAPLQAIADSASNIGDEPATLSFAFNTNRAASGIHEFALTVKTSDENLPGATSSELELAIIVGLGEPTPGTCPADLTGSGSVGVADLLELLAAWGPCPATPAECPADLTANGQVGVSDLLELLASWGPCPR